MADSESIAQVHLASIRSLGAKTYDSEVVMDWTAPLSNELYVRAMVNGALFFVAVAHGGQCEGQFVGFSSYSFVGGKHRTAVYVSGDFARCGIGGALFQAAESAARKNGAEQIDIDASIGAVSFYKAMGFDDLGIGEHQLRSGRKMPCVFMRKCLT